MNLNDWQKVDNLFQVAVALDPQHRPAFLDKACSGDQRLRTEIEALLSADSFEWDFIDSSAIEKAAALFDDEEPQMVPGQQFAHYEIERLVGRGGMGEVYSARDHILNRRVALKLLPLDYTGDEARLHRFGREAETVSSLNHPNILTIYELGNDNTQQFIATEFVEGETIRKHISRSPLGLQKALDIAIQTAGALAAAHRAGIVHRDIKPENIMLRPDGYVKVLDFGLAKLVEYSETPLRSSIPVQADLSSGVLMGTLRYMSPEQLTGDEVDARSDIFSLGVVMYEMISGRPPFGDRDRYAQTAWEANSAWIPEDLRPVIAKMLSADKSERYQNADELIEELKTVRDSTSGLFATAAMGPKAFRGPTAIVTALVVLATILGFGSYRFFHGTSALSDPRPLAGSGQWITKAPISSPRWHAEPAVLNNKLYVVGGWNVCTPYGELEHYDPENDTWTQLAPMLNARGGHGVDVLNGHIYAVGGQTDCRKDTASVEAYDPTSNSWSPRASLPDARSRHVVAAAGGKLYAIGGSSSDSGTLALNTEYSGVTDSWKNRAPMPTARHGAAAAVVDGIIYVIGGTGGGQNYATVEAYDPATDSWLTKRPMLTPRVDFAAAELGGILYVFGGQNNTEVEAYDPKNDAWTVVAEMPTRRYYFHAAAFQGSIYFAGGSDRSLHLSSVMAYTPEPSESVKAACAGAQIIAKAPMPTARVSASIGEIDGIIFVVGGYDVSQYLDTNEAYDPASDKWTTRAPMPVKRETSSSNSAVVDGRLYVIGGNAGGYCTNLNQAYDAKTDTWTTKTPMPTSRCHSAAVALDGLIYVMGGTNTNGSIMYDTVEIYDPVKDTWTAGPSMPTPRLHFGAVTLGNKLYAVGGWNREFDPQFLDQVEAYDPVAKTWSKAVPMSSPRRGIAVGVLNSQLIVIGGRHNESILSTSEAYDPASDVWTPLTYIPAARDSRSSITVNNTIHLIGGRSSGEQVSVAANEAVTIPPCQI